MPNAGTSPFWAKTLFCKRDPSLDHYLDEDLVYKLWGFPGHVHFSKACIPPHCERGTRLYAGCVWWRGESLMQPWDLLLVALLRGCWQLLGMLMLPAVLSLPVWPQASLLEAVVQSQVLTCPSLHCSGRLLSFLRLSSPKLKPTATTPGRVVDEWVPA